MDAGAKLEEVANGVSNYYSKIYNNRGHYQRGGLTKFQNYLAGGSKQVGGYVSI